MHIKSIHSDFETTVDCLVVPDITEQLPQTKIEASTIYIPKDAKLADSTYDKPGSIDMLLGAGIYWKIVKGALENQIKGKALQDTHLGVIIGGELTEKHTTVSRFCNMVTNTQLQNQLQRFWRLEEMPESRSYSKEEIHCGSSSLILLRNKRIVDSLFDCRLVLV